MTARSIVRELQALGARLERDGDLLMLRAGRHPIPQPLVERAREGEAGHIGPSRPLRRSITAKPRRRFPYATKTRGGLSKRLL